jgi:MFS family permease
MGIYLFLHLTGNSIFFAAIVFGLGIAFFWPCMIGFVAENLPRTGAVGLNLMGGAGMLAVSLYMIFMGGHFDILTLKHLPAGSRLSDYIKAAPGTPMAQALDQAKNASAPDVLHTTFIIPIILIVAFGGLVFYMNAKRKAVVAN